MPRPGIAWFWEDQEGNVGLQTRSPSATLHVGGANGTLQTDGALTVGAGGFTITGDITMLTAVSRIIPGATSFAIRNNANTLNNLLVNNAGDVTVRNGLTVTAGGATVTAGGLTVTAGGLSVVADGATVVGGQGTLLPSATAAGQTVNAADASARDITSSAALAYTGTLAQLRTPGLVAGAGGDTGAIALTALNIGARAFTNPGAGTALIPTVKGLTVAGPAGQANLTGVYTYSGIEITTPNFAANAASNVGTGLLVTMGTSNGAAGTTMRGVQITGGTQTAGTQTGLFISMAAATHTGLNVSQGTASFGGLSTFLAGEAARLLSATAAGQTVNGADATALDITSSAALAYTGTVAQLRTPGLIAGAGGDTGTVTLTALSINARDFTNPGAGTALIPIVRGIDITGPASGANVTGVNTYDGIRIVTPTQPANAAANVYAGLRITTGTANGAANFQDGINVTGGVQTAGTQRGIVVTMNAATHAALTLATGTLVMGTAASQLIPGATSFSLRNTANNKDNLIMLDSGISTQLGGTVLAGVAATAAGATYNPQSAAAVDITSSGALNITYNLSNIFMPGIIAGAAGDTSQLNSRGIVIGQRAFTNPGVASTPVQITRGILITGANGQANLTGSHQFYGIDITTPDQAANAAANQGYGVNIAMGVSNGGATTLQRGINITGGTQTAGTQVGINVAMAAATHPAFRLQVGLVDLSPQAANVALLKIKKTAAGGGPVTTWGAANDAAKFAATTAPDGFIRINDDADAARYVPYWT